MRFFISLFGFLIIPWMAHGQAWEFRYVEADRADELTTCIAGVYYSDGPFLTRVYGDQMDFFLADDSFALPPDSQLGVVDFRFKSNTFLLAANSGNASGNGNTSDYMFLHPDNDVYEELLQSLRYSSEFEIAFPDGTIFEITLENSDRALAQAFECWNDRETGPGGSNPFSSDQPQDTPSGNPFN